jgi:hypothetical protein
MKLEKPFTWRCPFCERDVTITQSDHEMNPWHFSTSKFGHQLLLSRVVQCPNPECRQYQLSASLTDAKWAPNRATPR